MPIRSITKWRLLARITNVYLALLSFILLTEDVNVDSFVLYLDNVQCERVVYGGILLLIIPYFTISCHLSV